MRNWYYIILSIGCLMFCSTGLKAGNRHLVDSLLQRIENTDKPGEKAALYLEIGTNYLFTGTPGAENYLRKSLALATLAGDQKCVMNAINRLGILKYKKSDYDSAIYFYNKCLVLANVEHDSAMIAKLDGNIGLVCSERGNYEDALAWILKSCHYQENHPTKALAGKLLDIANLHYHLKNYQKAYEMAVNARDRALSMQDSLTLGNAWNSMGVFDRSLGKQDEGLKCFETAYSIQKRIGNKLGQCSSLTNIADVLSEKNQFDEAIRKLKEVITLAESCSAWKEKATALHCMGLLYSKMGKKKESNEALLEALKGFQSLQIPVLENEVAELLAENYDNSGDFKNSVYYFKLHNKLQDSLFKSEMAHSIADMQTKYDTERKEKENQLLQKDNELNIIKIKQTKQEILLTVILSVSVIVLLALAYLFNVKQMKMKRKNELEKQLIVHQRLRLKEVVEAEEKERMRIAQELHDGLGQLLSTAKLNVSGIEDCVSGEDAVLVQNAMQLIDRSVDEVRAISHNLMPAALMKYGLKAALQELIDKINDSGKIKASFYCDDCIPTQDSQWVLYRVAQELLNNALKYASAKNIRLSIDAVADKVRMKVEDDGVGIDKAVVSDTRGIGWKNIISRVEMLNGKVSVQSDVGTGVQVTIEIPRV